MKLTQHCKSPIFQYKIKTKLKKHFKKSVWITEFTVFAPTFCGIAHPCHCFPVEALLTLLCDRPYPTQEEWEEEKGVIQVCWFFYAFASLTQFIFKLGFFSQQTLPFIRAQKSREYRSRVAEAPAPGLTLFSVEVSWSAGTRCVFFWRWLCWHRQLSVRPSSFSCILGRSDESPDDPCSFNLDWTIFRRNYPLTNYDSRLRGSSGVLKIRWLNPTGRCVHPTVPT